jgi:primase-polymerase (primpol)-like protein
MPASRDKSQGFGFVYPEKTFNFNRDQDVNLKPLDYSEVELKAFARIQENLKVIEKSHKKLHALLEELEKLNSKKRS